MNLTIFELNNGNVYDFISLIFAILALLGYIYDKKDSQRKEQEELIKINQQKKDYQERDLKIAERKVREAHITNKTRLSQEYRQYNNQIARHEKPNKEIYSCTKENLHELVGPNEAENIIAAVYGILDVLEEVYDTSDGIDPIEGSRWEKNFYYIFDPVRKTLFVSAFESKLNEYEWLENPRLNKYIEFVKKIIKENEEKHKEKLKKVA